MELLCRQGEVGLAGACKLTEPGEDQVHDLLHAQVGIESQPILAVPDVADWDGQAKLAAPRLGARRIEHARAQDAELEFADAALHPEQQAVVGAARVVDAVHVDDESFDEAAEFEQVMPVAAVASQTRGVRAQHGADFPGAQPRDEPIEAGAFDRAAGRTTQVVVDDLDALEAAAASLLDKVVLAALALQVHLHLGLRGLAHVDDGLAAQHIGRQQIRVGHRRPPDRQGRRLASTRRRAPASPSLAVLALLQGARASRTSCRADVGRPPAAAWLAWELDSNLSSCEASPTV